MKDEEKYTKLAENIVYSSIWEEDSDTCKIWVTILALKDLDGFVRKNVTGIARLAKLPVDKVEEAIAKFIAPDPRSTTEEFEGRRIEKVPGGLYVLNHQKFQEYGWTEDKKRFEREKKARWRQAQKDKALQTGPCVVRAGSGNRPASIEEAITAGNMLNIPEAVCRKFWNHYESTSRRDENGVTVWVTGEKGEKPIGKWQNLLKSWAERERESASKAPHSRSTIKDRNLVENLKPPIVTIDGKGNITHS